MVLIVKYQGGIYDDSSFIAFPLFSIRRMIAIPVPLHTEQKSTCPVQVHVLYSFNS